MEIGFIVLAIAFIPAIIYFFLPRQLKQRIQAQGHYFISDFGDRLQFFVEDLQSAGLSKELLELVRDHERAERLLNASRKNYSGKSKKWHLEKIIYDLKRGR